MSNNNTSKTQLVVAQVVRRLRAQSLLKWLLIMAAVGVVLNALLVTAYQFWLLPPEALQWASGVLALSTLAGVILGLSRKPKALTAAQKLDQSHHLKDRLSTAIELLSRSPAQLNEFEQAQLRDAEQHSQELVISRAAPWRWPQEALLLIAAVALLFATQWIESTPPEQRVSGLESVYFSGPAPEPARLVGQLPSYEPSNEFKVELQQQIEESELELASTSIKDPETEAFIKKLNHALQALADGQLTDHQIADAAAELNEQMEALAGSPKEQKVSEEIEKAVKKVGKELAKQAKKIKQKEVEELGKLLSQERFEEAAKKLEKLIELFKMLPKSQQEKLAKMFEKLAKKYQSKLSKHLDKLKKERSRLSRKSKENKGLSKNEKSRLNRLNKKIKRLERKYDKAQNSETRKHLDRLGRNMKDIAKKLRRQDAKKQKQQKNSQPRRAEERRQRMDKKAMKKMAEALRKMAKTKRRGRLSRKSKMRMADIKELMRMRRGRGGKGRKRLERLARGKGKKGRLKAGQGKKGVEWMKLEESLGPGRLSQGQASVGEGAGHGRSRMLKGRKTELKGAKMKADFVPGQRGKGQSRTQLLYGAAEEGTRVKGYGSVHVDYSSRAAQQMEREEVPPGYREYVEQYFRLIRKR